ncbi:hypothetical protein, partial [Mesorhizobium sp. B1-1-5]|uniref:hypothetical protein n=1 Tax=Mesorhizobium sp. B1-1-5 TaxID=2589979 RepID=UPI00112CC7DC
MNAITKQSRAAEVYLTEDAFAMKRHLTDAITVYGNGYDDNRASAIDAIASGRPAYWTTSTYSAARTVELLANIDLGGEDVGFLLQEADIEVGR